VIRHCHEQERKITALEQELRAKRQVGAAQDFGQMLDRHYLVNDRF